ncbi:hypothetical protein B0F90DRAFT_1813055 [Multifurca ochricompacta]|uniref:FAS1 domain-containing protein n=1 Tax=Multifurca ochricompacta TaxID=376703 RepID=A0AAD4MCH7_9AGAM|nr:hypothetical protein B0F90DRAFT_1813055 [Multifurca ochricompacta]
MMKLLLLVTISLGILTVVADQVFLPSLQMDLSRPTSFRRPTLFDLLTIEPSTSIFFSYARELELSRLFVDLDSNITLLAPTNKAVMALARKPPFPNDGTIELTEQELEERSKKNVEHWVSLHIIPVRIPIVLNSHIYPTLAEGKAVTFKQISQDPTLPEWKRVLLNGGIKILNEKEAINGVSTSLTAPFKTTDYTLLELSDDPLLIPALQV